MPDEKRCMVCGRIIPEGRHICLSCEGQEIPRTVPRIRTNGDRIRSMSNEEIALLLYNASLESCSYGITPLDWWLKWLESEADNA